MIFGVLGSRGSSSSAENDWITMSAWFLRPVPFNIDSMEVIASYGVRKSERHAAARDCFTSAGFPKCAYMIAAAARTVVVCFVILMSTTPSRRAAAQPSPRRGERPTVLHQPILDGRAG